LKLQLWSPDHNSTKLTVTACYSYDYSYEGSGEELGFLITCVVNPEFCCCYCFFPGFGFWPLIWQCVVALL